MKMRYLILTSVLACGGTGPTTFGTGGEGGTGGEATELRTLVAVPMSGAAASSSSEASSSSSASSAGTGEQAPAPAVCELLANGPTVAGEADGYVVAVKVDGSWTFVIPDPDADNGGGEVVGCAPGTFCRVYNKQGSTWVYWEGGKCL